MQFDVSHICLSPHSSIRQAIECIDQSGLGIALITDADYRLVGTLTDGDIRRAILAGFTLDSIIAGILPESAPIAASYGTNSADLLHLMKSKVVRHIPLLDSAGKVLDLVTLDDLVTDTTIPIKAVIMAGGLGTRLRPLTDDTPKPMLPVGDRPVMEWMIDQIRQAGISKVNVTTHYKSEKIVQHFGDGSTFGVNIDYVNESQPLGTGGALGLLAPSDEPLLVINGDILTHVDFRALFDYHKSHGADVTMGVRQFEMQVPYGLIECQGNQVRTLKEKPSLTVLVNAGIYLLEPLVYKYIPRGKHFNITDLIQWLIDDGRKIISFPIFEYWLDIGQHAEYAKAQADVYAGRMG